MILGRTSEASSSNGAVAPAAESPWKCRRELCMDPAHLGAAKKSGGSFEPPDQE